MATTAPSSWPSSRTASWKIQLCRYYRAQTKGKVESEVKYIKGNALSGRRFASLEALNEHLLAWCVEVADQRVHGTTHEKPAERLARAEPGKVLKLGRIDAPLARLALRDERLRAPEVGRV